MKHTIRPALTIIVGSSIFIGIPMLGWGINNANQFFNHPARFDEKVGDVHKLTYVMVP